MKSKPRSSVRAASSARSSARARVRADVPTIILASQSPARHRLMKRLGFKFRAIPAYIDEESFKAPPRKLVQTLAQEKARALAALHSSAIVIGSDQMLVLGRRIFGKPHTRAGAIEQLSVCSGRTIELLTAVTVVIPGAHASEQSTADRRRARAARGSATMAATAAAREVSFTDVTRMTFRKLSRSEIEAYVDLDKPLECAGSFMFEKSGISLFESIHSSDPTAIEGLPCLRLAQILRHALSA